MPRPSSQYRQMELNPRIADGEIHSPARARQQVEQARQQAEYYEAQRRELEESNEKKALFNDNLNEVGMKLHNAVQRLERELESMERETAEVAQVHECLNRHLQILSAMQPEHWSMEGFNERLQEAIPKLERAANDFEEAYSGAPHYHHTRIFEHKPGIAPRSKADWASIKMHMIHGLFFHLPLFLLLLLTWGVYLIFTHL